MEKMNVLTLIITLVVGVILTGALLGPVIDDATATEKTFDNAANSIAYFDKVGETDEITFEWDHLNPTVATINGEEVALPDPTNFYYGVSLITTEGMSIRYYKEGTDNYHVQSIGGGQTAGYYGNASVNSGYDLTLNISAASIANPDNTRSYSTTGNTYIVSTSGEYVMKSSDTPAYLLGDSNTIATGLTIVSSVWVVMGWDSNTGAEIEPAVYYPANEYTISNVNVDASDVDGYIGVTKLNKVTYTVTKNDDPTVTANITYSYFIVPASVTGELSQHLTPGQISLMGAIPVMVIVALLMVAVGAIAYRRAD